MKSFVTIVSVLVFIAALPACYYDKKDELFPNSQPCDTAAVTYSSQVRNVVNGYCISCHYAGNVTGIDLDSWAAVTNVGGTTIMGCVNHDQGFNPMPPNSGKLDRCHIRQLQIWIDAGMPNN
jgi:hypothetical protein